MRISDWSSDVCSSDLDVVAELAIGAVAVRQLPVERLVRHLAEETLRAVKDEIQLLDELGRRQFRIGRQIDADKPGDVPQDLAADVFVALGDDGDGLDAKAQRSEERRVGKECVMTCRSRW